MNEHNSDARHPASQTRLQQAHRDGDFAKSQELSSSFQMFLGSLALYFLISSIVHQYTEFSKGIWNSDQIWTSSTASINERMSHVAFEAGGLVLPLLIIMFLIAVLSHVAQNTTFTFFNKPLFDVNQLNPASGFQRLFSVNSFLRAILGVPKIAVLLVVCGYMIWQQHTAIGSLPYRPVAEMATGLTNCVFAVLIACTTTLFVMSLGDYALERLSFARRHRMTDQQLRDENRMQNSDPQVSLRRQQLYQDIF